MVKHIQVGPKKIINLGKIAQNLWLLCYFIALRMKRWSNINTNDNIKHPGYVWIQIL